MKESKFKVLMYAGQYVDSSLLNKGIYLTTKPNLYAENETIESLIEKAKLVKDFMGVEINKTCIKNLKDCELVDVMLVLT